MTEDARPRVITGSFLRRDDAQHALEWLIETGFPRDRLAVLATVRPRREPRRDPGDGDGGPSGAWSAPDGSPIARGAPQTGGAWEAVPCAAAVVLSAAATFLGAADVPAGGPLIAAVVGAWVGGTIGGGLGRWLGAAIASADSAHPVATSGTTSGLLVTVEAPHRECAAAIAILRRAGSREITAW